MGDSMKMTKWLLTAIAPKWNILFEAARSHLTTRHYKHFQRHGQVFSKSHSGILITGNKSIFDFPLIKYPNAHNVRITSPVNGEKVSIGKYLVIWGISAGNSNATYINCYVSIIVNEIKPYRPAIASGPSGSGDYSKWTFTLTRQICFDVLKAMSLSVVSWRSTIKNLNRTYLDSSLIHSICILPWHFI